MILRDPVHGLVSFEADELQIIPKLLATREVQRLRRIRQLGLTSLAYPGADHTRFSHAVGAAFVMTRLIARLREIHETLPYWQRLTTERARDAVAAALLHDVGHGPLSHLLETAIPNGLPHETWSERIVLTPSTEVHQVLIAADPGLPERVAQLIRGEHPLPYLAHAVSGGFDVDRCDYLLRDAHFTGVSYGKFDLDWLLRSLRFGHAENDQTAPPLAVDGLKGLPAIESFVLARLFMFQQVYFHKASRASEWAMTRILGRARELLLNGFNLQGLDQGGETLLRTGDTNLSGYLALDDTSLWHSVSVWRNSDDLILADLCSRLYDRKLFKTYELHSQELDPERANALHALAVELAEAQGLDPAYYVGRDTSSLVPFDTKDSLRVVFPDGRSHAPSDVSFILGRLRGETLKRERILIPAELRQQWTQEATSRGLLQRQQATAPPRRDASDE